MCYDKVQSLLICLPVRRAGKQLDQYIIVGIDGIAFLDHSAVYATVTDTAIGLYQ